MPTPSSPRRVAVLALLLAAAVPGAAATLRAPGAAQGAVPVAAQGAVPSQSPPASPSAAVSEAARLVGAGDLAGAEALLAPLQAAEPPLPRAVFLYGYCLHARGDLEGALAAHRRAAGFDATRPGATYNAACALALLGRTDEAFEWLARSVELGGAWRAQLLADTDLASLRADPRFAALLPPARTGAALFAEPVRVLHTLVGESPGEQFGWIARAVGDLDGDGATDFVATAPTAGAGGAPSGRVDAFSSKRGAKLWSRTGRAGERFGNSAAPAGDVDGDGVPDVIVGAPGGAERGAYAAVLSGRDGATLRELALGGAHPSLKVAASDDLDGGGAPELLVGCEGTGPAEDGGAPTGAVHVFRGEDGARLFALAGARAGDRFGAALAAAHDGSRRIAVGAPDAGDERRGRVLVYTLGAAGAELAFAVEADAGGRDLGLYFASFPGDLDGDGVGDVYASDFSDTAGGPHAGRVYLASGASGARLRVLTGLRGDEGFGTSPSEAGDLDGDGVPDLAVGAWQNGDGGPSAGRVYLVSGATGAPIGTLTCREPGDTFGFDSQGLGDVDGDGVPDLVATSAWSAANGPRSGRVLVIAGPARAAAVGGG